MRSVSFSRSTPRRPAASAWDWQSVAPSWKVTAVICRPGIKLLAAPSLNSQCPGESWRKIGDNQTLARSYGRRVSKKSAPEGNRSAIRESGGRQDCQSSELRSERNFELTKSCPTAVVRSVLRESHCHPDQLVRAVRHVGPLCLSARLDCLLCSSGCFYRL